MLYWLQMDAFTQRVLRSVEVKLLKLGELIFVRLFFHHMASHLREHDQHKQRLQSYLVGTLNYVYNAASVLVFSFT